jgi:hypothetical protein
MFIKKIVKISLIVNRKGTEREQKENRIEELAGVLAQ